MRKIIIGSRSSKLAVVQAECVLAKLQEAIPVLETSIAKITTRGDQDYSTPLDDFAQEGIFVKELEKALIGGEIDLAVHSLKDLPTEIPAGLSLTAVTARLDPRDVFLSRARKLSELDSGSKIGTGSLRRSIQLLALRNDLEISRIRGNIDTRLRKVDEGEIDGVIVAAAALIRLGWENRIAEYLPVEHFVPAVGQGALGIETRYKDEAITSLVSKVNHEPTWQCITAERTFLHSLGGGCRAPIAALGIVSEGTLKLSGMVASTDADQIIRATVEGDAQAPEQVGKRLAQRMAEMGALDLIAKSKPQ